jgi:hypothetical protein
MPGALAPSGYRDVPVAVTTGLSRPEGTIRAASSPVRARRPRRFAAMLLALLATSVAAPGDPPAEIPAPAGEPAYEPPGPVETAPLLPDNLRDGPAGYVAPQAEADGWHVTYTLDGPAGRETLTGTQFLANREREIRAAATLRAMNKSGEFGKAVLASGGEKLQSVADAVKDPVHTLQRLPQGASKFFGRLGDTAKHVAAGKVGATDAAESALGVQRKRAQLCLDLGVSPFTRDPELRAELDTAARAMAAGATLVNLTGLIVGGGVGTAISVVNANQAFQRALVESTPAELAARNRAILADTGADPDRVSGLLDNPAFNPWQKSAVTAALASVGLNPDPVLDRAAEASTDEDAVYFVQVARLLENHHRQEQPLVAIMSVNAIPCALDASGTAVVPVGADLVRWTPALEDRAREFVAWSSRSPEVKRLLLTTDGSVSAPAIRELSRLGIDVAAQALGSPQ